MALGILAGMSSFAHAEVVISTQGELTAEDAPARGNRVQDVYEVELEEGQFVRVELQSPEVDTRLILQHRNRVRRGRSVAGSRRHSRCAWFVQTAGVCRITVENAQAAELGQYELTAHVVSTDGLEREVHENQTLSSSHETYCREEHFAPYMVDVEQGDVVWLTMKSEDFVPYLTATCQVTGSRWEYQVRSVSQACNMAIVAPADGQMLVGASSLRSEKTGSFDLEIRRGTYEEPLGISCWQAISLPAEGNEGGELFESPVMLTSDHRPVACRAFGFREFRSQGYSAPHVGDIDGDGQNELLLGCKEGFLIHGANLTLESGIPTCDTIAPLRLADGELARLTNW